MKPDQNTAVVAEPIKFLLHSKNDEDKALIKGAFDLSKIGTPSYVCGLGTDAQMAMVKAALTGTKIMTTGLPIDIAASLGEITQIRAWNVVKKDGTTSAGSKLPVDYYVGAIGNREAYDRIKSNPDFVAAFSAEQADAVEESESGDF